MTEPSYAWPTWRRRLWVLLAVFASIVQIPGLLVLLWPPPNIITDFYPDWASARNFWNGLPLYTEHRETVPRYIDQPDLIWLCNELSAHPPTPILLMTPLARLDYRPALLAWNLLSLALLVVSLRIVGREFQVPLAALLLFALVCEPLQMQLFQGQWNLVLLALVTGSWSAERSGRPARAGVLLGAAAAIKLFPAFVFVYFALRGRWSALRAGALTVAALTALTAAVLGADAYLTYFRDVLPRLESFRSSWFNASLVGFWTKLFDPATAAERVEPVWRSASAARAGVAASWVAVVAAVAWCTRRARAPRELDHAFGMAVTAMLLLSPTCWDHAFLLLPIPMVSTYLRLPRQPAAVGLFALIAIFLFFWPVTLVNSIVPGGRAHGMATPVLVLTLLSCQLYALLALFCLGIAVARDRPAIEDASSCSVDPR